MHDQGSPVAVDQFSPIIQSRRVFSKKRRLVGIGTKEEKSQIWIGGVVSGISLFDEEEDTIQKPSKSTKVLGIRRILASVSLEHFVCENRLVVRWS